MTHPIATDYYSGPIDAERDASDLQDLRDNNPDNYAANHRFGLFVTLAHGGGQLVRTFNTQAEADDDAAEANEAPTERDQQCAAVWAGYDVFESLDD